MKFYKVYKDLIVRDSIDGIVEYDTDILCVIKMEEYDNMGIKIAHWNRDKVGRDILYKSVPFELPISGDYLITEICEVLEPENFRGRKFYKEVTYKIKDSTGKMFDFRREIGVSWNDLPNSIKNTSKDELDIFHVSPFNPVTYSSLQMHLMVIETSLNYKKS